MRLYLLILVEYIKRHNKYFLAVFVAVFIVLIAQFKFNFLFDNNSIRIGLIGTYQEHDLPFEVTKLISTSLVTTDANNRIKPNLVTGWESNADATVYKFKLKDNLKWSDGSLINSSDIGFSIPDVVVSYPDNKTIQFNLKDSYPPFPSLLASPIFKKGTLLGIGPYKISKIEKSRIFITKITLTPSDPVAPKIYVRFYPNESVGATGFSLGEVEALFGINNLKALPDNPILGLKQKTDFSKIVTVFFSMADSLVGGKNRSLRQALSYISPQIKNEEVADNPYPPTSWAYDKNAKKYLNNETEAKSALERAKSQIPVDKIHSEIVLTTTPNLESVANEIINSWRSLGLNVRVRVESGVPQNFQALLILQSIPSDPDQYTLWHATQTKTNISKVDVKRIDKDLEDARGKEAGAEDFRQMKYFDFQKALLEEAPAIFLYFPKYNIFYLKKSEQLLQKVLDLQLPKP